MEMNKESKQQKIIKNWIDQSLKDKLENIYYYEQFLEDIENSE
jgi:hypothetical protein